MSSWPPRWVDGAKSIAASTSHSRTSRRSNPRLPTTPTPETSRRLEVQIREPSTGAVHRNRYAAVGYRWCLHDELMHCPKYGIAGGSTNRGRIEDQEKPMMPWFQIHQRFDGGGSCTHHRCIAVSSAIGVVPKPETDEYETPGPIHRIDWLLPDPGGELRPGWCTGR